MDNKNIDMVIENLFVSDLAPPLTDTVIDAYLITSEEPPLEMVRSRRSRFIEKSLLDLHPHPVKDLREPISFGRWLKENRKQARLTQEDISNILDTETSYINSIEGSLLLPWQTNVENIIKLIILFRIHFTALVELFRVSFAVNQNRDTLGLAARTDKNADQAKTQEAIRKALEIHFGSQETYHDLDDEAQTFLALLKNELAQKGAVDLIT